MGEKVGHVMCEANAQRGGVSNSGETDCKEDNTKDAQGAAHKYKSHKKY